MTATPPTRSLRPRTPEELFAMDDGDLVAFVVDAARRKHTDQAELGTHMLLYRHEARMRRSVELRMPRHLRHHADVVADWVLERVTRSALKLPLRGRSPGEWVRWWQTAVERQVISFWRSSQGQTLSQQASLPSEEDDAPDTVGEDFDVEAFVARLDYAEACEAALASMDNPEHAEIVRAAYWEDLPSKEVAERFRTTANNVDVIKMRFRAALRAECERRGLDAS